MSEKEKKITVTVTVTVRVMARVRFFNNKQGAKRPWRGELELVVSR